MTGRRSSPIRQAQVHRRPGAEDHRHRAMRGGVAGRGRARLAAGPTAKPVGGGAPAKWRGLSETPPLQRLGRNPGALLSGAMAAGTPPSSVGDCGKMCCRSGVPSIGGPPPTWLPSGAVLPGCGGGQRAGDASAFAGAGHHSERGTFHATNHAVGRRWGAAPMPALTPSLAI